MNETTTTILNFWFDEVGPDRWWVRDESIDEAVRARFEPLWCDWREKTPDQFLTSAKDALAAILLFDQFPRHMFRDTADAFSTDPLALAVAHASVAQGLDMALPMDQRHFLYMPFMHSETHEDQQKSLLLFTALGNAAALKAAQSHAAIIETFGRFPHRNAMLGRSNRPGEAAAIAKGSRW